MLDYQVYKDLCKPGYIYHLRLLGMYHLRKSVDNEEDQIITGFLPIGRHRQSRPSRDLCPIDSDCRSS